MCSPWRVAVGLLLLNATSVSLQTECPQGQECTACIDLSLSSFEIYCGEGNERVSEPHFRVEYRTEFRDRHPFDLLEIQCVNAPEWSNFHLSKRKKMKPTSVISFTECDLPTDIQLIVSQLFHGKDAVVERVDSGDGAAPDISELKFNSYGNLRSALAGTMLAGFTNSVALNLSHNGLRTVPDDLLQGFTKLKTLDLAFNDLCEISSKFLNLSSLQTLILQKNNILVIERTTFTKLPCLEVLDLSENQIMKIDDRGFDTLGNLLTLNLRGNNLITLSRDLFKNLENLTDLNLSNNDFSNEFLSRHHFSSNNKLKTLELSNNKRKLTKISTQFLSYMFRLRTLKLDNIGIRNLPSDLFLEAPGIWSLSLSHNYLVELPDGLFYDYVHYRVRTCNFSHNYITHISENNLKFFRIINNLDMSYNKIEFIDDNVFRYAVHLRKVNFSNNKLTLNNSLSIENSTSDTVNPPFYENIKNIEELNFDNNNITMIPGDWLRSESLEVLLLRNNHITHLSSMHLCFHSSNTVQLDLRDNKIFSIDLSGLESSEFDLSQFRGRNHFVVSLQLANNPIICDCSIYYLLRHHERRMDLTIQRLFEISIEGLTCAGPSDLLNIPVKSLNSKMLQCRVPTDSTDNRTCPDDCDCFFRVEDRAFIVNCSHRDYTRASVDFNAGLSWHTEMYLTGNSLKNIPAINQSSFSNVTVLFLAFNQITHLSKCDLSENLTELYLNGNNLTELNEEVIQFLANSTKLQNLTLHENPWKCDCSTLVFFNFVQTQLFKYTELQRVKCNSSNIPIFKMSSTDMCPSSLVIVLGTSLAAVVLIVTIIFVALYYRFQTEIKVWLFAHRLLPWLVNETELDRDKVYDAFISYSHQDEDFVAQTLVPKLEEGPHAFKLCLHYRDWPVGEWVAEQIARSVAESRRTIVVLSRNFLESEWGKMEFRTAHSTALSEGRARVIVIIYGDIGPIDELEPELVSYMRTNTYVQWGDRWFWEKLLYALPHPANFSKIV